MANQAWQITSPGTITLKDVGDVPKTGPREALVKIHAASLNYRDKLVVDLNPAYPVKHKANLIPGSDGAGVVAESGSDSIWRKGDRIVVHPNTWTTGFNQLDYKLDETNGGGDFDGTLCRWMVVKDDRLFRAPKGLSMEEASTLFTAGVTAYRALFHGGVEVKSGMKVLTQGTGGVSCYAIMVHHPSSFDRLAC